MIGHKKHKKRKKRGKAHADRGRRILDLTYTGCPTATCNVIRYKLAGADGHTVQAQEAEARWEFSLAASNLPAAIAPDIRRLLRLCS